MANYQVLSLDPVTPQIRAPGTGNGYSFDSGATNLGTWTTSLLTAATPLTLSTGTQTTSAPIINGTQTWNNAATTFTGLLANVTDTASASASLLIDLQVGGSSKFSVKKNGDANFYQALNPAASSMYINLLSSGILFINPSGGSGAVVINSNSYTLNFGSSQDLILARDAADTLAQRRSTNAQTFRVYNTYTDASNYERAVLDWGTSANLLTFGTQKAGTGSARDVAFVTGGTERMRLSSAAGNVGINTIFPSYQEEVNGSLGVSSNAVMSQIYNAGGNNLLTYSEQFDNAAWNSNTGVTLTANNTTAPDGNLTGYKMLIDTSNGRHYVGRTTGSMSVGATYTSSVYVKAGTATKIGILPTNGASPSNYTNAFIVVFDLSSASIVYVGAGSGATSSSCSITAVGNGWYRISAASTNIPYSNGGFDVVLVDQTTPTTYSYTGNGTDYVYIWGAQFEKGFIASTYTKTTASTASTANVIYQGAGTAALPSLAYNADPATGLWQPAVSTIGFSTAGAEKARFDSSGNFGLGLVPVASNGILQLNSYASVKALLETATVSATAATGTINFDVATQAVLYYTTNSSANWTVNVRANSSTALNTIMQTGQSCTITFLVTNGTTGYYNSAFQVDGVSVTPKWLGGTAPTTGNASSVDVYTYTIVKTGSAAFTVFASQTQFK